MTQRILPFNLTVIVKPFADFPMATPETPASDPAEQPIPAQKGPAPRVASDPARGAQRVFSDAIKNGRGRSRVSTGDDRIDGRTSRSGFADALHDFVQLIVRHDLRQNGSQERPVEPHPVVLSRVLMERIGRSVDTTGEGAAGSIFNSYWDIPCSRASADSAGQTRRDRS